LPGALAEAAHFGLKPACLVWATVLSIAGRSRPLLILPRGLAGGRALGVFTLLAPP
jgi:hypothetical protein